MYFFMAGVVSEEELEVIEIDEDTVTLNEEGTDDEGNEVFRKFDRKTGKCLNDNTWMGARRYIKRCSEK